MRVARHTSNVISYLHVEHNEGKTLIRYLMTLVNIYLMIEHKYFFPYNINVEEYMDISLKVFTKELKFTSSKKKKKKSLN